VDQINRLRDALSCKQLLTLDEPKCCLATPNVDLAAETIT